MLKRILREPLVHFAFAALAIFVAYALLNPSAGARNESIVVSAAKIEQLGGQFVKTWQRPPSDQELKGLIDEYVADEVYYRQALALGLDKDDPALRRRLRLKLEFLLDSEDESIQPTDAELAAYLEAKPTKFAIDPEFAVQQIFLNPAKRGARIDADAEALIAGLAAKPPADPGALGDETLLPYELPLTDKAGIAQIFGPDFADAIEKAPVGRWSGPVVSAFGLHLVRVGERKMGRIPDLAEARDRVAREWSSDQHKLLQARRLAELLKRYKVTIEPPPAEAPAAPKRP
jgi:parvulin-like peptidyl-prolyl isomerase